MIEVNNLVKRYGDHTAVDHLSFKIEKGKIYGFLGPNGAGKSTTMNMTSATMDFFLSFGIFLRSATKFIYSSTVISK